MRSLNFGDFLDLFQSLISVRRLNGRQFTLLYTPTFLLIFSHFDLLRMDEAEFGLILLCSPAQKCR